MHIGGLEEEERVCVDLTSASIYVEEARDDFVAPFIFCEDTSEEQEEE